MLETTSIVPEEQRLVLSSLSPGPAQKRLALAIVLGILVVFVLITLGLVSGVQARRIDAFLPAYLSAMFVCDSITAVLLFAQFSILRTRAILVIAKCISLHGAYPDSVHPDVSRRVCAPGIDWRAAEFGMDLRAVACGFPLFVIGYALSKDGSPITTFVEGHAACWRSPGVSA